MQVTDGTPLKYWHDPLACWDPRIASPVEAIAIGWLGLRVPPATAALSDDAIAAITWCRTHRRADQGKLPRHTCAVCTTFQDGGELLVLSSDAAAPYYVAPAMIVHYISAHGYVPPSGFIAAALRARLAVMG